MLAQANGFYKIKKKKNGKFRIHLNYSVASATDRKLTSF